jgi:putative hemolysin
VSRFPARNMSLQKIGVEHPLQTSVLSSPLTSSPLPGDESGWRLDIRQGTYHLRLAASQAERRAAFRLRFLVFNLELSEGLEGAYSTGCDMDEFDEACDHLIVEHRGTGAVVGTYRVQTGATAAANGGYYSEREFDFMPYLPLRSTLVELGRACVHRDHRTTEVLYLLWRGIAQYACHHGARFLIGCSSLTSQDPAQGSAVFEALQPYLVEPHLRTVPSAPFVMPLVSQAGASSKIPKLLRTYLAVGARICGPPAIDREFKTIDFLTLMDLEALHPRLRSRFLVGR